MVVYSLNVMYSAIVCMEIHSVINTTSVAIMGRHDEK